MFWPRGHAVVPSPHLCAGRREWPLPCTEMSLLRSLRLDLVARTGSRAVRDAGPDADLYSGQFSWGAWMTPFLP